MSVTAARGFVANGVACGIRKRAPDLAVIRSLEEATGAALFTTNQVQAAPVVVSKRHLSQAQPQAVVINSGVANAATGAPGEAAAIATAAEAARLLDLAVADVLVLSTGVIGVPLPLGKIKAGLKEATAGLGRDGGIGAAEAIMTTDSRPKLSSVQRGGFTVGGMAKGSGMIHPALATMLAVITTDYALEPGQALEFLGPAVESSFNSISVDGECSTNDAVVLLANGASSSTPDDVAFGAALGEVCGDLSRQLVSDGEGASVLVEIGVSGSSSRAAAKAIAARIATSTLVKTAAFGRDPNWGRVLAAAGSARRDGVHAEVDVDRLTLRFNDTTVFRQGKPTGDAPDMGGPVLRIDLDLGLGECAAGYLSTDLTHEYVELNSRYTT